MLKTARRASFLIAALFFLAAAAQATDLYWVSFGGVSFNDPKFVMQIDQMGNVTMPPCMVVKGSDIGGLPGATALGKNGSTKLNLWMVGQIRIAQPAIPVGQKFWIFRAILKKGVCMQVKPNNIGTWTTDWSYLQASQTGSSDFLTVERPGQTGGGQPPPGVSGQFADNGVLWAALVYNNGMSAGKMWRLSPRTDRGNDVASVASDAMMALSNDHDSPPEKIYTQPLKAHGLPTQIPPFVITNYEGTTVHFPSVDISNTMSNGRRLAAYSSSLPTAAPAGVSANLIKVQQVDGMTGEKILTPQIVDNSPRIGFLQTLAIDPKGRFMLFNRAMGIPVAPNSPKDSCTSGDELVYQALDSTGNAVGSPIVLTEACDLSIFGIQGIDILME